MTIKLIAPSHHSPLHLGGNVAGHSGGFDAGSHSGGVDGGGGGVSH